MRNILSVVIITIAVTSVTMGQQNEPIFFPNKVIIKYQSESTHSKITATNQIDEIITEFGGAEIVPLWKNEFTPKLQRTLAGKGKIVGSNIPEDLQQIFELTFNTAIDPVLVSRKLASIPGVEYAEPRYIRLTSEVPNDPLSNIHNDMHNFYEAWDITTGSSDVIIGIVDSGVNYNHIDLRNKMWKNEGEIPENQIDDDGNGFIDDVYGWDFWESGLDIAEQDSDPFANNSDHGTHVGGIAGAQTDNGTGISGTGYNSTIMAVKVGGIEDDPSTDANESRYIGFGYDGIIYAVLNGADIVNCSWGGSGVSNTEQEVIDFAVAAGVVVVTSAGNDGETGLYSPASYDGVLSVGSVGSNRIISDFSNYGYTLDVLAVGESVTSTSGYDFNDYRSSSGTSMASPVVAGLAALIKSQNPDWSPKRIITQIRGTAVPFGDRGYNPLLGTGTIDAERALSSPIPGLSVSDHSFSDSNGGSLSIGETGLITLDLVNHGQPTSNLVVSVTSQESDIIINSDPETMGALATNDITTVTFSFDIPENFDLNDTPTFIVDFYDQSFEYNDYAVVQYNELSYDVVDVNNITVSFGVNGTIGFSDVSNGSGGIGFIPEGFSNILYEGGLIMAAADKLSSSVRDEDGSYSSDFNHIIPYSVSIPGELSDADGSGSFAPNESSEFKDVNITLKTYAFSNDTLENVVFTQFIIENITNDLIEDYYFGIFSDWDVDNYSNNFVDFSAADNFMFIYDETEDSEYPYVTIAALQSTSANLAIDNAYSGEESAFQFNIYDGYSDIEKLNSLIAANNVTSVSGTDVSSVVASGPYNIGKNTAISLGFIYAYGNSTSELMSHVQAAKARSVFEVDEPGVYTSTIVDKELPGATTLYQNYPNPFNPASSITFDLSENGNVELSVYNILGQKVQTLINQHMLAGSYTFNLDAKNLANGMYIAVLKTNTVTRTIKMTLVK